MLFITLFGRVMMFATSSPISTIASASFESLSVAWMLFVIANDVIGDIDDAASERDDAAVNNDNASDGDAFKFTRTDRSDGDSRIDAANSAIVMVDDGCGVKAMLSDVNVHCSFDKQ